MRQGLAAALNKCPLGQVMLEACEGEDLEEQLATSEPVQQPVVAVTGSK